MQVVHDLGCLFCTLALTARQKLPVFKAEHILYAEDYVEPILPELAADLRFMANIDPDLFKSTLLDPIAHWNLKEEYERMYRYGISIRLCPYDGTKGKHFPLMGPPVTLDQATRSRQKTVLGNRPKFTEKVEDTFAGRLGPSSTPEPQNPLEHADLYAETKIADWIQTVPDDLADEPPTGHSTPVPTAHGENDSLAAEYLQLSGAQETAQCEHAPPTLEVSANQETSHTCPVHGEPGGNNRSQLLVELDEPAVRNHTERDIVALSLAFWGAEAEHVGPSALGQFDGTVSLIDDYDTSVETALDSTAQMQDLSNRGIDAAHGDVAPPLEEDLIDLAPNPAPPSATNSPSAPITWAMRALEPTKAQAPLAVFQRHTDPGSRVYNTMDQQTGRRIPRPTSPNFIGRKAAPTPQLSSDPSKEFVAEIETAMMKLFESSQYFRGKVSVRVDMGRVIITESDFTALAFNNANEPSNGWGKTRLVHRLNTEILERNRIIFSGILTTYGDDAEKLIRMKVMSRDGLSRMWKEVPSTSFTVYSFHCQATDGSNQTFLVEIKDDQSSGRFTYTLQHYNRTHGPDGDCPLYIHGLRRRWDLRVMLTHVDTVAMEAKFGEFAKALLRSLRVTREGGERAISFAVHEDTQVAIKAVRVLTKWRHAGIGFTDSMLEVTEVEQLEFGPSRNPGDKWEGHFARAWSKKKTRMMRDKGEFPRWYEASVVSRTAEELFGQNQSLLIGQKTAWTTKEMRKKGIFASLYLPAIQMLRRMDGCGANEDNHVNTDKVPIVQGRQPQSPAQVPMPAVPRQNSTDAVRRVVPGATYSNEGGPSTPRSRLGRSGPQSSAASASSQNSSQQPSRTERPSAAHSISANDPRPFW